MFYSDMPWYAPFAHPNFDARRRLHTFRGFAGFDMFGWEGCGPESLSQPFQSREIRWMMKIYEDDCLWCSHSIGQSFTPPYSMWLISLLARHVCFIVKQTMFLGEWRGYGLNINFDALPISAGCLVQDISEGATEDISCLAPGISCCGAGLKDWFTIS